MRTDLTPDLIDYLGAMARRLCGTPEAAQDLAQEALLRLWALEEAPDNPRAYAVVVLRNLYRQALRDRVETVQIEDDLPGAAEGPGAALALAELEAALARLPRNQARLMRLVAVGETSPAELARITGCPVGTVNSRLARARARLRQEMGLAADAPVRELF